MGLLERASIKSAITSFTVFEPGSVEEKIYQFYDVYKVLNCIVFDTKEKKNQARLIQNIIDRAGSVLALPSGNSLILLRGKVDRELIAHRLSKSLNLVSIMSLESKKPEKLIDILGKA